ncbi:class I SAM-dependent methyltransferase [Streptomyces sp. NPDC059783]|uniref:class I SAM-dependent methyltransferase n=1 Tax=Streptomyces sp. NPDC059783 TaxID=3346944 RepID=UPI003653A9D5
MGPAEGENAAFLARAGVEVTAVDFSVVQVERARRFWKGERRLTFVHAGACAFLDADGPRFDAIHSTWGAGAAGAQPDTRTRDGRRTPFRSGGRRVPVRDSVRRSRRATTAGGPGTSGPCFPGRW